MRSKTIKTLHTFDAAVIGAGIAGASVAYHLKSRGLDVAVIDKGPRENNSCRGCSILLKSEDARKKMTCKGASGVAGAFISPMLGKPNPLKEFINNSFKYTVLLYKELAGEKFIQNGLLRLPEENENINQFDGLEQYIDVEYEKRDGGYFFKEAGLMPPDIILKELIRGCSGYFGYEVKELVLKDGLWIFDGFMAKNVILATGAHEPLVRMPYSMTRGIWGERIRVSSKTRTLHNYHRKVSVSTSVNEDEIIIGATHKKEHGWKIDDDVAESLLRKAGEIIKIQEPELIDIKAGMRPGSIDYYPIIGQVVDIEKNLKEFEHIRHGTKVPYSSLNYINGLYIHTGHGGRGFVTAPKTSLILADFITENKEIDKKLDSARFFYKWIRKEYNPVKNYLY